MKRKLATTVAATASAAAIAVGGLTAAGPAFAYPPGTGVLTVSTNVNPVPLNPSNFTVTVENAKPGSTVTVRINRGGRNHVLLKARGVAGEDGTVTFTFRITGGQAGTLEVKADAHDGSYRETATTTVAVAGRTITAPTSVSVGAPVSVSVTGYDRNKRITLTAIRGSQRVQISGRTTSTGTFTGTLTLPSPGTWAIVATSQGRVTTTSVTAS